MSKTNEGNFTQFWSYVYLGSYVCWLDFGFKRSRYWWPTKLIYCLENSKWQMVAILKMLKLQ